MKENLKQTLAYHETFDCVQCGYCLPACPTYKTMEKETHSPRGRINLVKMAAEGKVALDKLQEPIDLCLGCRACERVCPTEVEYGKIFESAKAALQEHQNEKRSQMARAFRSFFYQHTFPKKQTLTSMSHLMWFYQKSGLKSVTHRTGLMNLLPDKMKAFDQVMPEVTSPSDRRKRPDILSPQGETKYRVAFFTGCVMDAVFDRINDLSMKLLQAAGCEVIVIPNQTCCGAIHMHSGELDQAKQLAKENIKAFEGAPVDYIVNNAGGCGAMLSEYDQLFADELEWKARARELVKKSTDISVLLNKLPLPFKQPINKVVTYQPSCHMTNVQKVIEAPLELMKKIEGIDFREMKDADMCCGSAGIYNIVNYEASMDILDEKIKDTKKTQAHVVVTTNPGCLLQMKVGIERHNLSEKMQAVHLIELLAEACGGV